MDAKYRGRRFAAFILTLVSLNLGFFLGRPEMFAAFTTSLGLVYGVYLTGQSATNWKKYSNGG